MQNWFWSLYETPVAFLFDADLRLPVGVVTRPPRHHSWRNKSIRSFSIILLYFSIVVAFISCPQFTRLFRLSDSTNIQASWGQTLATIFPAVSLACPIASLFPSPIASLLLPASPATVTIYQWKNKLPCRISAIPCASLTFLRGRGSFDSVPSYKEEYSLASATPNQDKISRRNEMSTS